MPRSASDATRFTSTTPHATSHAAPRVAKAAPFYPHQSNPGNGPRIIAEAGPAGETPQQKVARLRAAAARAREGKMTGFDKAVVKGRVWADRAHRITALGLIGITGIAGVVTIYALGDMIIYNRKKKREYFAEQKAIAMAELHAAQDALAAGKATEAQFEILIREGKLPASATSNAAAGARHIPKSITESTDFKKAQDAANMAASTIKEETKGAWATAKSWVFAGLKKEEDQADPTSRLGYEGTSEDDDVMGIRSSDIAKAVADRKTELEQKAKKVLEEEKQRQLDGGPLDRLATKEQRDPGVGEVRDGAVGQPTKQGGGWTSFMTNK